MKVAIRQRHVAARQESAPATTARATRHASAATSRPARHYYRVAAVYRHGCLRRRRPKAPPERKRPAADAGARHIRYAKSVIERARSRRKRKERRQRIR